MAGLSKTTVVKKAKKHGKKEFTRVSNKKAVKNGRQQEKDTPKKKLVKQVKHAPVKVVDHTITENEIYEYFKEHTGEVGFDEYDEPVEGPELPESDVE